MGTERSSMIGVLSNLAEISISGISFSVNQCKELFKYEVDINKGHKKDSRKAYDYYTELRTLSDDELFKLSGIEIEEVFTVEDFKLPSTNITKREFKLKILTLRMGSFEVKIKDQEEYNEIKQAIYDDIKAITTETIIPRLKEWLDSEKAISKGEFVEFAQSPAVRYSKVIGTNTIELNIVELLGINYSILGVQRYGVNKEELIGEDTLRKVLSTAQDSISNNLAGHIGVFMDECTRYVDDTECRSMHIFTF